MNGAFSAGSAAAVQIPVITNRFPLEEDMKTPIATFILTVAFLSAGAFAGNELKLAARSHDANVTVITKNQAWPLKGQITLEPCRINPCRDA
jgi:hypothetical protein